jgi:hypothetical protein
VEELESTAGRSGNDVRGELGFRCG